MPKVERPLTQRGLRVLTTITTTVLVSAAVLIATAILVSTGLVTVAADLESGSVGKSGSGSEGEGESEELHFRVFIDWK